MNISELRLLKNSTENTVCFVAKDYTTLYKLTKIYHDTFYCRWIVINDFHIPVKKPEKALKNSIVITFIVTMVRSLFIMVIRLSGTQFGL